MDRWDFLQFQVALLYNSTFPGCPADLKSKKPIRGVCQRLKGKQGRFRVCQTPFPELSFIHVGELIRKAS